MNVSDVDSKGIPFRKIGLSVGIAAFALWAASFTIQIFWPEVFMSKNNKLTSEFNKTYSSLPFDTLRVKCWVEDHRMMGGEISKWSLEFKQGRRLVTVDGYDSREKLCLSAPSGYRGYVIKAGAPGYMVLTSGEEMAWPFDQQLTDALLRAVAAGQAQILDEMVTESSWMN